MAQPKTTIELNGKRYDARTGKIINDEPVIIKPTVKQGSGAVLDGFTKRNPQSAKPALTPTKKLPKTAPNHAVRKIEKSKTLMRPAVKKPEATKHNVHPKQPSRAEPSSTARQARAAATTKSPFISRFGNVMSGSVIKKEAHLPVAPVATSQNQAALVQNPANQLAQIEQAIHSATAHLEELEKDVVKRASFLNRVGFRNKIANITAMTTAFLMLGGFFAYQNAPAIEMRLAATRSGVSASMPGYKPTGYGVAGSVKSEPGKVSVSFKSRTDGDKNFKITQEASNWTSAALLANEVSKKCDGCYQTYQNDGKTVYIYDNSNATWVDKGIRYQVEGNASLTSDQLLRLANSF